MKKTITFLWLIILTVSCKSRENYTDKGILATPIGNQKFAKVSVLPFAHSQDEDLKEDFQKAFERYQNELEFTSVILTAQRWAEKKDYNGRPLYRERLAAVTATRNEVCYVQHFSFRQDFDGKAYEDRSYVFEAYGWKEFDCSLL